MDVEIEEEVRSHRDTEGQRSLVPLKSVIVVAVYSWV